MQPRVENVHPRKPWDAALFGLIHAWQRRVQRGGTSTTEREHQHACAMPPETSRPWGRGPSAQALLPTDSAEEPETVADLALVPPTVNTAPLPGTLVARRPRPRRAAGHLLSRWVPVSRWNGRHLLRSQPRHRWRDSHGPVHRGGCAREEAGGAKLAAENADQPPAGPPLGHGGWHARWMTRPVAVESQAAAAPYEAAAAPSA